MKLQKGFAPLIAVAVIAGAMVVGIIFQRMTDTIDHPAEQASERILANHGIDIDFSKDKKEKLNVR